MCGRTKARADHQLRVLKYVVTEVLLNLPRAFSPLRWSEGTLLYCRDEHFCTWSSLAEFQAQVPITSFHVLSHRYCISTPVNPQDRKKELCGG